MNSETPSRGVLFVLSAPSGTGKTSVARRVVERVEHLEFSVSYTTREPRSGERDGRDYHFVDANRFERMIREGQLLEWAEVFGRHYGTGLDRTRRALGEGRDLVLDIDVQGARQVRRSEVDAVSILLLPPDYPTLRARLEGRGSEGPEAVGRRLAEARDEMQDWSRFDYVVINDRLDATTTEIEAIVSAERARSSRRGDAVRRVLESFPYEERS